MRTYVGQMRRVHRAWLIFAEHFAREAGIYRLLDWLAARIDR